jgi:hypothetical protein
MAAMQSNPHSCLLQQGACAHEISCGAVAVRLLLPLLLTICVGQILAHIRFGMLLLLRFFDWAPAVSDDYKELAKEPYGILAK